MERVFEQTNRYEAIVAGRRIRAYCIDVVAATPAIGAAILIRDRSGVEAVEINGVVWEKDPATGGAKRVGGNGEITIAH